MGYRLKAKDKGARSQGVRIRNYEQGILNNEVILFYNSFIRHSGPDPESGKMK
jgi:hypothetical protein